MLQDMGQVPGKGGGIHGPVQERVGVGLLVGGGEQVIELPEVHIPTLIPAEGIVPVIIFTYRIDLGIAKLQVRDILFQVSGQVLVEPTAANELGKLALG
jgi:hypothetical protein